MRENFTFTGIPGESHKDCDEMKRDILRGKLHI